MPANHINYCAIQSSVGGKFEHLMPIVCLIMPIVNEVVFGSGIFIGRDIFSVNVINYEKYFPNRESCVTKHDFVAIIVK
ncbi:MAG: hypothetical protein ACI8ZN_001956 [Bacteroidia bacterium]|jgi:hypothetical protein